MASNEFGFKSTRSPPFIEELKEFEDKMLKLVSDIKFKETPRKSSFQKKMSSDIKEKIRRSDDLLIKADKTSNFYRMKLENYEELLHNNITKTYKIDDSLATSIVKKSKNIAENLGLDDRIETTAKKEPFITLEDHKPNFDTNPKCRLTNPAKTEIGKISKQILDRINKRTIAKTNTKLWRNTRQLIEWFKGIRNKPAHRFISFDVVEFYPSITGVANQSTRLRVAVRQDHARRT